MTLETVRLCETEPNPGALHVARSLESDPWRDPEDRVVHVSTASASR